MKFNVALILLYNAEKKVLLQHRTDDAPVLPGYWAFFGGRLKSKETPLHAIRREAREELECELTCPQLLLEYDFQEGASQGRLYVFSELYDGSRPPLTLREGQGWGWFDAAGAQRLNMVGRDREILGALWKHLE